MRQSHPKELLERFGYRPKKKLGQNFLMDAGAAARIARLAAEGISPSARILEIGPGTGQLTKALLDVHPDVTAIDIDPDMVRILRSQSQLERANIVEADALAFDYETFAHGGPWRMTGNLPYNIATPLIMRLIEMKNGPQTLAVMIQKEVAGRIAAQPGTRAYGSLSVAVQYAMRVERAFTLGPGAFYPRPKIDSTVIRLTRLERRAVEVADEHWFLQVVRAAFAYRRKTLANSLSLALGTPRALVAGALHQLEIDTEIRGEQLSLADFARLADRLRP
jgi:16S rRNA (adenine1518-N6/adenine1519-N6)-dimethyltransferase